MSNHTIELFVLKCSVIESGLRASLAEFNLGNDNGFSATDNVQLEPFIKQFDLVDRQNGRRMSKYYEIFYLLENDIRRLIIQTMETAHGTTWWETHVPEAVLVEVKKIEIVRQAPRCRRAPKKISITPHLDNLAILFARIGRISLEC
jgi:hypothetical protein